VPPTPDEAAPAGGDAPAESSQGPADDPAPAAVAPDADSAAAATPKSTLATVALIIAASAPVVLRARAGR
jgi:hypothetical protein